ncbi:MAG: UDP-N-acetylmuramoyl-L-alanine--D-glutamate ligase [Gemmatimonadales bacterium]
MTRIAVWQHDSREVAVAGLGRSGAAAVALLESRGIAVYPSDAAQTGHDLARIARAQALILSPGIPPEAEVVRTAVAAGVPVLAEAQLGLDALAGIPYVAITGTNGKTTTTALLDQIFRSAGRGSVAAGNIGLALSAVALQEPRPEWLAVELSSFQLHDMPDLAPNVGILTNLAPDHLDRYPSIAAYFLDKARLFTNASPSSIWVSNLDDPDSRVMIAGVQGRHLAFTTRKGASADAWFDHDAQQLMLAGRPLLLRGDLPLLGDHNVANALAASLAAHATGVSHEAIAAGLHAFHALKNRVEPVREVNGVLWINDSKATNIASTMVALQAMTRPYVLLLGGRHKGEPYTGLLPALAPHCVAVVAYGEAGDLVEADLAGKLRVVRAGTFEEVVAAAGRLAPVGGAVLLSPACSSYDMFKNYEERGAIFRQLVEAM